MYNPSNPNTLKPADTQPQGKRQSGSGFTNINKLLDANKGAGTQMGQQIGGGIGQQAGKVVQSADASSNKFLTDYAASKGAAQNTITNIGNIAGQVGAGGTVASGGLSGMSEGEAAQKGREFVDAKYAGPTALAGSTQLTNQASTLGERGKAAIGGSLGQKDLLKSMIARPGQYTRGQTTLDSTLMGQSNQAQQALQQGAQNAFQAQRNIGMQQANASNLAQQAGATISQQKDALGGLLNKNVQDIRDAAATQATAYNNEGSRLKLLLDGYNPENKALISDTNKYTYTDADVALLDKMEQYGLDPEQHIYGKNEVDYGGTVSGLASGLDVSQTSRYTPEQQAAARNLALMSQQDDVAKNISDSKFNDELFNKSAQVSAMGLNKTLREHDADIYKQQDSATALSLLRDPTFNTYDLMEQISPGSRAYYDNLFSDQSKDDRAISFVNAAVKIAERRMREINAKDYNKDGRLKEKSLRQIALERMGQKYTSTLKDPPKKELTQVD